MNLYWSLAAVLRFTISGIILSSVIVLSLIPLYAQVGKFIVSNADKTKDFQFVASFTQISKRDLVEGRQIDYVDSTSFSTVENFLQNLLMEQVNILPRTVTININEVDIDYNSTQIYFVGYYLFDILCNSNCQTRILNQPVQYENQTVTVNNLSISNLNYALSVTNMHGYRHTFQLLNFSFYSNEEYTNATIQLTYSMTSIVTSRAVSTSNGYTSLQNLIQQTLTSVNKYWYIPFQILASNQSFNATNLTIYVAFQLQYPVFFKNNEVDSILSDLIVQLPTINPTNNITYQIGSQKYAVTALDISLPSGSAPVSLFNLQYSIPSGANVTVGPITDPDSLQNIRNGIKSSLNTSATVVVEKAYIVSNTRKYRIYFGRIRRRRSSGNVLVVIIRLVSNLFGCNRQCQQSVFTPIINAIQVPPLIVILGISLSLSQPTVYDYAQNKPIVTTTTTTTTTSTLPSTHQSG